MTTTRKERKIERTKKLILESAIAEFAENGYTKSKITSIAARSDLAAGTIYNYFDNKETLFVECINQFVDQSNQYNSDKSFDENADIQQILESMINNIFARNQSASAHEMNFILSALPDIMANERLATIFYHTIVKQKIDGIEKLLENKIPNDLDTHMLSELIYSAILGSALLYSMKKDDIQNFDPSAFTRIFTQVFSNGLHKKNA